MPGDPRIPTIGLTGPSRVDDREAKARAECAAAQYQRVLRRCGASVVDVRPEDAPPGLDGLDGLLLSGGGDIAPHRYHRDAHEKTGAADCARDEMELALTGEALSAGLPVLGICRGAQVLGVALGGDLIQDLGSEAPQAGPHDAGEHTVELDPRGRLARLLEASQLHVNSSHHQANGRLGDGVRRSAWSADGVIEAIEWEGSEFAIGVQWHPERMWENDERQLRLFEAFVAAAAARRWGGATGKGV